MVLQDSECVSTDGSDGPGHEQQGSHNLGLPLSLFLGSLVIPSFLLLSFTCFVSPVPELSPLLVLAPTFLSSAALMYINPHAPLNKLGLSLFLEFLEHVPLQLCSASETQPEPVLLQS